MEEFEFEDFVKDTNENIESVTTCLAEDEDGFRQHGIVMTIKGVDIVLLSSELQDIVDYLEEIPFVN